MKAYLSSPFFNEHETENCRRVLEILERKHIRVYAPMLHQTDRNGLNKREWAKSTFQNDIAAIQSSDIVILLFYGLYSDSGSAWECGYAYALNKKIITVHLHNGKSNCMVNCSCHANIKGIDGLETYDFLSLPEIDYYL